ncbi:2875_t:CDS:10 [Funneliformis caledonium]|uniref:2875_t:CDS:1 n=1 Tax=Funneliformis caledonium TaxID=1117310 RepID=A0A9N8WAK9_9GLOM|nr:2875_t:CDS:10 [Funneliformis caledonium]
MVSINKLDKEELAAIIAQELHIDVAFPYFSVEEQTGATACCVVHKHWLSILKQARFKDTVQLKRYTNTRSPLNSSNNSDQLHTDDLQSSTTNVLVSVFLKRQIPGNRRPQLFSKVNSGNSDASSHNFDEEIELPIRTFLKEQLEDKSMSSLEEIEAQYNTYVPIFIDQQFQNEDALTDLEIQLARQEAFVKKFIEILYPESAYFRIKSPPTDDSLTMELLSVPDWSSDVPTTSPNLIDVFAVIESDRAFYFMAPYRGTSLQDLLKYSSGVLDSNVKKSFILYQLLKTVQKLHQIGVIHGGLKPSNILVDENLWVTLTGFECSVPLCDDTYHYSQEVVLGNIPKEVQDDTFTMKWVRGDITNFNYIMSLNYLAGRRIGDPNFHPIFPWITDFTGSDVSKNWRDFTKTKFRLNKGDEQLDFTFDGPIPHHITDILSDITYFVYLARKTPVPVLCQYVRTKYEPNEYPSSLQRLFEWTPDECIPEFYTDPSIFTSIHPDMPDLQLPMWASSAEEFIRIHSEALESDHVSSHLHQWIDLTFGCKLSGKDAVESKNVALPLIDGQNSFMKHGITQLFSDPHPQKSIKKNNERRSSVYMNGDRTLLEKYEMISSKRRIPSKITDSDFKISSELMTDFLKSNGAHKTIGKLYHQTGSPNLRNSKSPRLGPTTPRSLSLYETVCSIEEKKDNSSSVPSTTVAAAMVTNSDSKDRIEILLTLINSLPIHLPDDMNNEFFIEKLSNFEQAHSFAAKYLPNNNDLEQNNLNKGLYEINIVHDPQQKRKSVYDEMMEPIEVSFAYGRAWDTYSLGKIIESIYHTTTDDINLSLPCNKTNCEENQKKSNSKLPLPIQGVISSLINPDWRNRPSIDSILYCSVPVTSFCDQCVTFPLPICIPEVYEFLTDFHKVDWIGRLKLAEHWMDRLCNFTDEAFYMILPSLVLLFTNDSIKFEALNIFSSLGQRLGQDETKAHLLKPIVSLFESSRPSIPKILFDSVIIKEFIHKFGIPNFLQQLFPLYLESLTIEENVLPYKYGTNSFLEPPHNYNNQNLYHNLKNANNSSDIEMMANPISILTSSLDNALPSVALLANGALVDICTLIGPILSSKYIMKQVYKMFLKESPTLNFLMQSVLAIETFTQLQFTQVISIIQQYSDFTMNNRNYAILCNHFSLLEKLTTLITSDSSTSTTSNKKLNNTSGKSNLSIQIMKNKFSISIKTMEFILNICNHIEKAEWEKHASWMSKGRIAPILVKYFELFGKSVQNNGKEDEVTLTKLEQERDQQIMYAYSQFCTLFESETIRQAIPNSEIIDTAILDSSESYSSSRRTMSPSYSLNETSSDRISITSASSENTLNKEKNPIPSILSATPTNLRWNINFEDKKHLTLLPSTNASITKEVATITTSAATTSSGFSVNRAFSLFGNGEVTSRKLLDINHHGGSGGSHIRSISMPTSVSSKSNHIPNSSGPKKSKLKVNLSWRTKSSSNEDLKTFQGHVSAVRSIDINEHSRLIVSGSKDRTVKLWSLNIHQGIENSLIEPYSECLKTYTGHRKSTIGEVHFFGGGGSWGLGDNIVSCDGQVHIWDPETGTTINQFGNFKNPYLSIKPIFRSTLVGGLADTSITQTLIAVGFTSGVISLLESRTGTLISSWKAGDTDIVHMTFYTNNYLVSCAPADHVIYIWDTDTVSLIKTIRVNSDIVALKMYKDEVITINNSNTITFFPLNDNKLPYSSKFKSSTIKSSISSLGILPINQLLLLGCLEGDLFLYA